MTASPTVDEHMACTEQCGARRVHVSLGACHQAEHVFECGVQTSAERDMEPVVLPTVTATNLLLAVVPAQSISTNVLHGQ